MSKKGTVGRWGIVVLYLALCGLYFLPIVAPYKLTYPLLALTLASLWSRTPSMLTLALAFSALGDLLGAMGYLLPQIGAFAVAQVCYIVLLGRQIPKPVSLSRVALASVLPLMLCVAALMSTLPAVEGWFLGVGVVLYALLIGAMVCVAMLSGGWLIRAGALLFMFSDFLLAYAIFVTPAPALLNVSLTLYFLGQLLLWSGAQNYRRG